MIAARDEERARLLACKKSIEENLVAASARLETYAREIQDSKDHMWEARRDMDHIDKVALRQSIEQKMRSAEVLHAQRQKLIKLRQSPYFGRFDFTRESADSADAIYVGVHDFRDDQSGQILVHDWRAPASSMFYDYEIGPARYEAPSGEIQGRLDLKRQFRIRGGGDQPGGSDRNGHPGLPLRDAHRHPATAVHLQSPVATDRDR